MKDFREENPDVIVGDYRGKTISQLDHNIYVKRITSNCFVYEDKLLDREKNIIIDAYGYCVIDFHDGDHVNFKRVFKEDLI
jgi:hypothetical protein